MIDDFWNKQSKIENQKSSIFLTPEFTDYDLWQYDLKMTTIALQGCQAYFNCNSLNAALVTGFFHFTQCAAFGFQILKIAGWVERQGNPTCFFPLMGGTNLRNGVMEQLSKVADGVNFISKRIASDCDLSYKGNFWIGYG